MFIQLMVDDWSRNLFFYEDIYNWGKTDFAYTKECANNDWLKPNATIWTIMPRSSNNNDVAFLHQTGYVRIDIQTNKARNFWPALYLKSSVKILPNDNLETYGSINNPFLLSN